MTDPHDDHALDELASAHLDGVTTPEEELQIAADPELQRRVARLGSVRAALAESAPIDDGRREAAITAALDAFDADADASSDDRVPAVTRLADRRVAALPVLAAAAVVVLIAAVATLLQRDAPDDENLSAGTDSSEVSESGAASGGVADEQATSSDAAAGAAEVADLGDFADLGALATALRADDGAGTTTTSASAAPESDPGELDRLQTALGSCADDAGAFTAAGDLARATVAGEPVLVVTRPVEATGGTVALVLDRTTCAVLLEVAEEPSR